MATQDSITPIRPAIRGLLRAVLCDRDSYTSVAKPAIDWTDEAEQEALN